MNLINQFKIKCSIASDSQLEGCWFESDFFRYEQVYLLLFGNTIKMAYYVGTIIAVAPHRLLAAHGLDVWKQEDSFSVN